MKVRRGARLSGRLRRRRKATDCPLAPSAAVACPHHLFSLPYPSLFLSCDSTSDSVGGRPVGGGVDPEPPGADPVLPSPDLVSSRPGGL